MPCSAPVFEEDGRAPRGDRCVGEELSRAFKLDASAAGVGRSEGAAAHLGRGRAEYIPDEARQSSAADDAQRAAEGDRVAAKMESGSQRRGSGDAVQLDPLVPAVAAPLQRDGNDFAD